MDCVPETLGLQTCRYNFSENEVESLLKREHPVWEINKFPNPESGAPIGTSCGLVGKVMYRSPPPC